MHLASKFLRICIPVAFALGSLQAVHAQSTEATTDELIDKFNKQKTRGLVLVPAGQATDTNATTETATTVAAAGVQEVAREDQINIQISFDFDSAALREDQKPKLANMCAAMQAVDVQLFQIIGHTDSSGSAEYNENLSLLRAKEVKRHLVSDCGIDANRLEAIGLGESNPYNKNDPRSDENRRVEFQALG